MISVGFSYFICRERPGDDRLMFFCVLCSGIATQFPIAIDLCCALLSFYENWPLSSAGSSCSIPCCTVAKEGLNKPTVGVGI